MTTQQITEYIQKNSSLHERNWILFDATMGLSNGQHDWSVAQSNQKRPRDFLFWYEPIGLESLLAALFSRYSAIFAKWSAGYNPRSTN